MIPILGGPRYRMALKYITIAGALSLLTTLLFGLRSKPPRADLRIPLRILPLGDSITWGWHPDSPENGTDGYRAKLLYELTWGFYQSADFVGTQHSGLMFDDETEGHVNATIGEITAVMKTGLEMRPNVVLVHAGTIDLARPDSQMWENASKQLGSLLDGVVQTCPDAVVLVAKIIQARDEQTNNNIESFNKAIPEIVEERAKKGFKIRVVDQSVIGVAELADDLHPSYAGYMRMGIIWAEAIKAMSRSGLTTPPVAVQT